MKRTVLLTLTVCSLFVLARASLADGYVPDEKPGAPSASDSANSAKELDKAASEPRASMNETVAIQEASGEELSAAIGHYARARSLLIAALREFDQGYKLAKPDAIIDSAEWRASLISRGEDLERVLAPQARASKFGVRYDADPRLLGEPGNLPSKRTGAK